jgi:hypothetical protein
LTATPLMRLTSPSYSSRLRLNPMQKLHLRNRESCSDKWGQLLLHILQPMVIDH